MMGMMDDKDFEAEMDLHTLMEADEIRDNADRRQRVQAYAAEKAADLERQAASLRGEQGESDLEKGYTSLGKLDMGGE